MALKAVSYVAKDIGRVIGKQDVGCLLSSIGGL